MSEAQRRSPFQSGDPSNGIFLSWWRSLENDRGGRAMLRRCGAPSDAAYCPAYHRLLSSLESDGCAVNRERLAMAAALAARVKADTGPSVEIAREMAMPRSGGTGARVSGLRFRRLLAAGDRDEAFPLLLRAVQLLDGRLNLLSMTRSVYWWNDKTRRDWAFAYYSQAPGEA